MCEGELSEVVVDYGISHILNLFAPLLTVAGIDRSVWTIGEREECFVGAGRVVECGTYTLGWAGAVNETHLHNQLCLGEAQ